MRDKLLVVLLCIISVVLFGGLLTTDFNVPKFNILVMCQVCLVLVLYLLAIGRRSHILGGLAAIIIVFSSVLYVFALLYIPVSLTIIVLVSALIVNLLLYTLFL